MLDTKRAAFLTFSSFLFCFSSIARIRIKKSIFKNLVPFFDAPIVSNPFSHTVSLLYRGSRFA